MINEKEALLFYSVLKLVSGIGPVYILWCTAIDIAESRNQLCGESFGGLW